MKYYPGMMIRNAAGRVLRIESRTALGYHSRDLSTGERHFVMQADARLADRNATLATLPLQTR